MAEQKVRSTVMPYTAAGTIKLPHRCKSAMIKNLGDATATLWGFVDLTSTSAPISLPNYDTDNCKTWRVDEIDLTFGVGTKNLVVICDIEM